MTAASLAPASHSGRSVSHLWLSAALQGDLFWDMPPLRGAVAR